MSSPTLTRTVHAEVRALPGGRVLVTTPADNSYALDVDAPTMLRMLDSWATGVPSPFLPAGWEDGAAVLFDVLDRDGAFTDPEPAGSLPVTAPHYDTGDGSDADPGDLLVTGDPEVVAALQNGSDRVVRAVPADDWQRVVHRAFRTRELLVYAVRGADDATLIALDRLCSDARTPWVAVEVSRSTVWIGPFVTPGVGANYEDFAARRTAAAFDAVAHRALRAPAAGGDAGRAPHHLGHSIRAAAAILGGTRTGDLVTEIAADGTLTTHPVLPLPTSVLSESRPHTPADLVDRVTGLVQRTRDVVHHPSIPSLLATAQSDVCNMRRVSRWANNTSCQGSAFGDPEQARASAIGEAAERYCGNLLDTLPVTVGSYDSLRRGATRVLDPDDLVLYSDKQYDTPGFPFVRMTHDLEQHWVPGRSLTTGETVLVPASTVYVNWFTAGYAGAPVTTFCPFAGIAAGPNLDYAVTSALEEIIERHATMVWWLNGQPLDAVDPGDLADVWNGIPADAGQRPSLIHLDNEFGVPVMAGVLHNDVDTLVNVGFACRDTPEAAALKAWTEACTLQEGSRDLLRADGAHWDAMARGELNSRSFKPWRADRRYLDSYREDMRDCDDLMVQQQVHLDPRAVERVAPLLERPAARRLADLPRLSERTPAAYQGALEAAGHEVIIVDITSPDIASTGMAVVRAIVPGTVGNAPAAFPFLGRGRVQDLAVELGWRAERLAEHELNYFPRPSRVTRVTVHALGGDQLVVCGDDGRRWILTAPAVAVNSDAVRAALDEIRASGPNVEVPVGQHHIEVDSTAALHDLARTCDGKIIVLWRYAGRLHRILLDPLNAPATADLIGKLLRAGVAEPAVAAALTEPPLIADPLNLRLDDDRDAGADMLERWEGDAWVPHRLRPAPSVDSVTGVLRRIVARPIEPWHPPGFQHLHAELPHLGSVDSRFQPDALAPAAGFSGGTDTPEHVALLSGIAHYCGAYLGQGRLRRATAEELRASGDRVLTVAEWRPHDPALHEMPGFPFVRDDDRAVNWWLAGDERGETCWVPISLVHAGYLASRLDPLPSTNSHNLVGLCAGTDLEAAAERAAAHVIAHDAVSLWWRKPNPLPECELPAAVQPTKGRESTLDIRLLAIPTSTGVRVRLAVVDDREKDIVSLGFAAAAEPQDAALTAVAEALIQHASARDLDSPDSLIRSAESIGNGGVAGLAPFDRHRRYAETVFADARGLIDPMCHVQYGLSASSVARVRRRTIPHGSVPDEGVGAQPLSALLNADARVIVVDVTTPRVREAGYTACRVLAPAFERLAPAAFPLCIDRTPPYPGW